MIYTSYYGRMKRFPRSIAPINIARYKPFNFEIPSLEMLYPSDTMIWDVQNAVIGEQKDIDEVYTKEVLNNLKPQRIYDTIMTVANGKIPCLMCYEVGECHRHTVAQWLNKSNIDCEEINVWGTFIDGVNYIGGESGRINPIVQKDVNELIRFLRDSEIKGFVYVYGEALTADLMPWSTLDLAFDCTWFPQYYTAENRKLSLLDLNAPNVSTAQVNKAIDGIRIKL